MINKLIDLAHYLGELDLNREAREVGLLTKEGHSESGAVQESGRLNRVGRFIVYALRHNPRALNISLDEQGWVDIEVLLEALSASGKEITKAELERLVEADDKHRLKIDAPMGRIRASQGHSVSVDLGYEPEPPPEYLYHGTNREAIKSILSTGLHKMKRHAVHLSKDLSTAIDVGSRRGPLFMLRVQSGRMHEDGYVFRLSENGVWLTNSVPVKYIEISFENSDLMS